MLEFDPLSPVSESMVQWSHGLGRHHKLYTGFGCSVVSTDWTIRLWVQRDRMAELEMEVHRTERGSVLLTVGPGLQYGMVTNNMVDFVVWHDRQNMPYQDQFRVVDALLGYQDETQSPSFTKQYLCDFEASALGPSKLAPPPSIIPCQRTPAQPIEVSISSPDEKETTFTVHKVRV